MSGHSTSSALIMAASKGILHSLGHVLSDPREIVGAANRMICNIVSDSGMFLTQLYGVCDRAREELEIVSAGHDPVFLVAGGGIAAGSPRVRLPAPGGKAIADIKKIAVSGDRIQGDGREMG